MEIGPNILKFVTLKRQTRSELMSLSTETAQLHVHLWTECILISPALGLLFYHNIWPKDTSKVNCLLDLGLL